MLSNAGADADANANVNAKNVFLGEGATTSTAQLAPRLPSLTCIMVMYAALLPSADPVDT